MIVIVSDLHLQHTALDVLRREEDGKVLATKVVRNVDAGALGLLFSEIWSNVQRTRATEVHLVLAGDIFELHRTPLWLLGGETLRPTLSPAAGSPALEAKTLTILEAIEHDNAEFFAALARFVASGDHEHLGQRRDLAGIPVQTHYVPGNHDRLADAWPSTREKVRALLGVAGPGGDAAAPFPHVLDWPHGEGYGVRVRHGHEYDPANFGGTFDPAAPPLLDDYRRPALGDFVTVDIATRLAVAFRAHYARELRLPGAQGDSYRRIYVALTEFDDVRPQTMLVQYLTEAVAATESATFSVLRPVLRDAFETARADPFFASEARRLDLGRHWGGPVARIFEAALANLAGDTLAALISLLDQLRSDAKKDGPAAVAQHEAGLDTLEIDLVIAGHTHEPAHVALPRRPEPGTVARVGTDPYFLDTGTWRTRIESGVGGAFGRLRGYTMVFCYHDSELRPGEARRFETWTGHLRSEEYGPRFSVDETPDPRLPPQTVRFVECRVHHVDEGETRNGAELVLCFGVDGNHETARFDGVRDGAVLAFSPASLVMADPALDGELWCYGIEKDLGDSILDRDDAMPWAADFLSRKPGEPTFVNGRRELRAADNRGNAFTLVAEVG